MGDLDVVGNDIVFADIHCAANVSGFRKRSRLFLVNLDHAHTVAVDVFERAANTGGVLAVEDGILGLREGFGDCHEERVFKGGIVGVEGDGDFHCAATLPE